MKNLTEEQRQRDGCGLLPLPVEKLRPFVGIWAGGSLPNYKGPRPLSPIEIAAGTDRTNILTVCPGYSTSLPDMISIARSRLHWSKGQLIVDDISDPLAIGIEILEGVVNEFQQWGMTPSSKDGGGEG